jgi:Ca2+/H+ antiporter, TMEM165/GDT1 family
MLIAASTSSSVIVLVGAVFLASAVEMVEALTIVVAVGHTQGWRPALRGTVVALAALAALVAALGPALVHVPIDALRLVVGGVLLIFGLQWLRKAILRACGIVAMHDEDAIYQRTVDELEAESSLQDRRVAFVLAFKGVFLEGLEVVIIVLTLGTSAGRLGLAVFAALAALVLVGVVGVIVARQLSKVPENIMKMTVGVLLVSYGTFFSGEGLKVRWPGGDATLAVFVGLYALVTWLMVVSLRSLVNREAVTT